MRTWRLLASGLVLVCWSMSLRAPARGDKPNADESVTFRMQEINVLDLLKEEQPDSAKASQEDKLLRRFASMNDLYCTADPSREVKAYPKLKSDRPYYGTLIVDGNPIDRRAGKKYHFVVDESGETVAAEEKASPPQRQADSPPGKPASKPDWTKRRYDRLYIDLNGDLDLTNDPVVKPMKSPPAGAVEPFRQGAVGTCFDCVTIWLDYGPPIGRRSVRFVPRLMLNGPRAAFLSLLPATAWKGEIRIGRHEFAAVLCQQQVQVLSARWDSPYTWLFLVPKPAGKGAAPESLALGEMPEIDGQLYAFSSTPAGDALTVRPYRGDFGVFAIGAGGRKAETLAMRGLFLSDKGVYLAAPDSAWRDRLAERPREVRLPVGDYVLDGLDVELGDLMVGVADLRSAGEVEGQVLGPPTFPIQIRKDKPYVFALVNKPDVSFSKPGKEIFRPGDEVQIEAALIDPVLGVRITELKDKRRKIGELKVHRFEAPDVVVPRYASLDPTVVITNAAGAKIAEGKMPFG
jgi:hypothetical protein